ncbi:MAG: hypothetical protein KBD29_02595 [Candidatus Magasanikbacteria bacterium]|nr:hypothetical protein [Candidatus Magasanikbacteria bacterium]
MNQKYKVLVNFQGLNVIGRDVYLPLGFFLLIVVYVIGVIFEETKGIHLGTIPIPSRRGSPDTMDVTVLAALIAQPFLIRFFEHMYLECGPEKIIFRPGYIFSKKSILRSDITKIELVTKKSNRGVVTKTVEDVLVLHWNKSKHPIEFIGRTADETRRLIEDLTVKGFLISKE